MVMVASLAWAYLVVNENLTERKINEKIFDAFH